MIEEHAADPAVDPLNSQSKNDETEDIWVREEEIYNELAAAFPLNQVYWATWSSDGHHGLRGLYRSEASGGYQTYPRPVSHSENGRWALRQGRSFEGHELLVFEGHVPNGHKRVYKIAFYREQILQQMSNEAIKTTQQDAPSNGGLRSSLDSGFHPRR